MARTRLFRSLIRALRLAHQQNWEAEARSALQCKQGWTRRRFLKTAALAGSAALATTALPRGAFATIGGGSAPKVAIVGGGIAGLNAAYQLQKAGIHATVYEARRRVGGRIHSVTGAVGEGLVTDLGGELINTDHEDMLVLVREFGLRLFSRVDDAAGFPLPDTAYFFDGQALSEEQVAFDLQALAAQIARDSERLDSDFDRVAPLLDRLSVSQYLDRHADRIPKAYIRTLIENSIRTEYGVEPGFASPLELIFNLPTVDGQTVEVLGNSDEAFVVEGGTGKIIKALEAALRGQIRTRHELVRVEAEDSKFQLQFASGYVVSADFVILTIPFSVLRDVEMAVPLPRRLKRFIRELDLGRNEKLIAGFSERVWQSDPGFVNEAWTDLGFAEVWDATERQPDNREAALTFFLGGREVDALRLGSVREVGRTFVQRLEAILPGTVDASNDRFLRTRWAQSRFTRGAYSNFKPGQLTRFGRFLWIDDPDPSQRQEVHVGNLVFAGEHLSDAFFGFMNGAAETGRLAADLARRRIVGR